MLCFLSVAYSASLVIREKRRRRRRRIAEEEGVSHASKTFIKTKSRVHSLDDGDDADDDAN